MAVVGIGRGVAHGTLRWDDPGSLQEVGARRDGKARKGNTDIAVAEAIDGVSNLDVVLRFQLGEGGYFVAADTGFPPIGEDIEHVGAGVSVALGEMVVGGEDLLVGKGFFR